MRAVWSLALAASIALAALVAGWLEGGRIEPSVIPALLLQTLPGLAGVSLIFFGARRLRGGLLAAATLAAVAGAAMTGGLSGPAPALVFLPLFSGLALSGGRNGPRAVLPMLGALGSGLAATAGLVSALAIGVGAPAPTLSAVLTLIVLTAGAAALWLAFPARAPTRKAGQADAILGAQPALTLTLAASGRVIAAFGTPPPGLTADALFEHGLVAAAVAADRPAVQAALDRAQTGLEAQLAFTPAAQPDRRVALVVRPFDERRLVAQLFDDAAQQAREARLEAARQEAEDQSAGKSRFLANMSHELRTPLNAVIGFSDIMRQRLFGPLPDRYADYAQSIHEAGGHLLDLINDVLDVSKIEASRFELQTERFDAREPISAALALVRLGASQKGVTISGALPPKAITVEADKRALKQIALNLLSNAIKFTPAGGAVTLSAEAVGDNLELVVSDTGVGIAPEDLPNIGKPFQQVGPATQKSLGTGLGLALVRSLAELHGGAMTVESTLGQGAAVMVRMPVIDDRPREAA